MIVVPSFSILFSFELSVEIAIRQAPISLELIKEVDFCWHCVPTVEIFIVKRALFSAEMHTETKDFLLEEEGLLADEVPARCLDEDFHFECFDVDQVE